jgi:hypothetical protein
VWSAPLPRCVGRWSHAFISFIHRDRAVGLQAVGTAGGWTKVGVKAGPGQRPRETRMGAESGAGKRWGLRLDQGRGEAGLGQSPDWTRLGGGQGWTRTGMRMDKGRG